MYTDKRGNILHEGKVVVNEHGNFYKVDGFDTSREYFVKLSNGCVKCYDKPANLLCIDSVSDFYKNW
ncbi:hypothetical protein VPHF99_0092 [Vibrio phage F99]|nr:hypothetical protein MYOV056v2_p0071 [Vibrio phage 184E37.3a]QZI87073.1 hypothetical protein MYOV085v1_p0051 [Vibrio phage 355E48.1]QZI89983.1 hypothetical protein MYOV057v1_p0068 [Vibrio phage 184E37.1]